MEREENCFHPLSLLTTASDAPAFRSSSWRRKSRGQGCDTRTRGRRKEGMGESISLSKVPKGSHALGGGCDRRGGSTGMRSSSYPPCCQATMRSSKIVHPLLHWISLQFFFFWFLHQHCSINKGHCDSLYLATVHTCSGPCPDD